MSPVRDPVRRIGAPFASLGGGSVRAALTDSCTGGHVGLVTVSSEGVLVVGSSVVSPPIADDPVCSRGACNLSG